MPSLEENSIRFRLSYQRVTGAQISATIPAGTGSYHRVACIYFAVSGVFEPSPRLTVPLSLVFSFKQTGTGGSHFQGGPPLSGAATARDLVRFAFCSTCQEENVAQFNLCWKCGAQPVRSFPAPRYPEWVPVVVDVDKMQARRRQVQAAMEGRPGQVRKSRMADEFDAFVLVVSAGSRGWQTATPDDVFTSSVSLTRKGKASRWCMKRLAPVWATRATVRA